MENYKINIKCTYRYWGEPQAVRRYEVDGKYHKSNVEWLGNEGYGVPTFKATQYRNCLQFGEAIGFYRALVESDSSLRIILQSIKEGESKSVYLTKDNNIWSVKEI